jgi:lipopolysaccharide transport system ATP-binding protein
MSAVTIRVEELSKMYRIGAALKRRDTLRDRIAFGFKRALGRERRRDADPTSFWALKDVSFEIAEGVAVGIIGRNGAGKSTLLKILSRITTPTAGRAEIHGRVGSLLEVGTGFHGELTGRENVYLNGAILGMGKAEIDRKFDEIVEFADVARFLDTPVKHYSSGMHVRLAFAVAANLEPETLIVDEVLAVGDAAFQRKCIGKMQGVARTGRTVLFVTHNMPTLMNLCPQSILLEAGRVVCQGPTAEVVSRYLATDQSHGVFSPRGGNGEGDQRARIVDFKVSPNPAESGVPMEFVFTLERPGGETKPLAVELACVLFTEVGTPVLEIASHMMGVDLDIRQGTTRVVAKTDGLPLTPGRYRMNLWMGANPTTMDVHTDCYDLVISPGRLESGEVMRASAFPLFLSSLWQVGG